MVMNGKDKKTSANLAHVRPSDGQQQTLQEHLEGVAKLSRGFASKIGLDHSGELIGLVHDLGKYSQAFQNYLKSAVDLLNPDDDEEFVNAKGLKGKIDHSTAGAQLAWRELSKQGKFGEIAGQILSLCIASHHSGLIDCLTLDVARPVEDGFTRRINKVEEKAHFEEALTRADASILARAYEIVSREELLESLKSVIRRIIICSPERSDKSVVAQFHIGLLVRLLFSCLIDGDRINSADFEKPWAARSRLRGEYVPWNVLIERLDAHLASLKPRHAIDEIRNNISRHCFAAATRDKGLFTLSVPTGGGKTLASLRFALCHANRHAMDRVVYVIPFTSIIDQNADVVRDILEPPGRPEGSVQIVLEHHSNLTPEQQSWRDKLLTDNWDAPVVYTTSVQFLEALFGAGTRGARRMHQLANAVIVFDEIQTLPIRCVHLFNNAVNFLVEQCGSTVILCTATQPLLDNVDRKKGAIALTDSSEIMPNVQSLFDSLKRVSVTDSRKPGGWAATEIADLAQEQSRDSGSCLVVVNTKKMAKAIYLALAPTNESPLFHLSTSMCPAHRRKILAEVRARLASGDRVRCVSTQLIEAGVDVDFGSVIRCLAGLDSIAQAAGRCNRNGLRAKGIVSVVNPAPESENLRSLTDITIGRDIAERIIDEYLQRPGKFDDDLIGPKAMTSYYEYYFFRRTEDMAYKVSSDRIGRDDTLLNLLSRNSLAEVDYCRSKQQKPEIYLRQSFMTAAKAFQAIDAPTQGVIVPYGIQGREIVNELCAVPELEQQYELLRRAQQFTVNVFPNVLKKLIESDALNEVQEDSGIYYLNERYYSEEFGLATEPVADEELAYV